MVLDQTIISKRYIADLGPLNTLSQKSVGYVAVYASDGMHSDGKPSVATRDDYNRRKAFYSELASEGELIWNSEAASPISLHPRLLLYRLPGVRPPLAPGFSAPHGQ